MEQGWGIRRAIGGVGGINDDITTNDPRHKHISVLCCESPYIG